jgi:fumarate hydratase subunit alpha
MRGINTKILEDAIYESVISATYKLSEDLRIALKKAIDDETSESAKYILNQIVKNYEIAMEEKIPLCQDTGRIIIFIEMGQETYFSEGFLLSSLNRAISRATADGYLRKSSIDIPFSNNYKVDNVPPIIHIEIVRGDRVKIYIMLKGAGAENASFFKIYTPTNTLEEVKNDILEWIKNNAAKACPPVIVGIGIGGDFEYAPLLAKKALLRKLNSNNKIEVFAEMEKELLEKINETGIGPMGIGGKTTALAVHIETAPTHIASIPVAVNLSCHSLRFAKIVV